MDSLADYRLVSQAVIVLYILVAAVGFVRSRYRFSPVLMFMVFFFIYSFSFVLFINLDLANRVPGVPRVDRAAFHYYGFVQSRAVYDAFFIQFFFFVVFFLSVSIVRFSRPLDAESMRSIRAYSIPRGLLGMTMTALFLVWLWLFLSVFGSALQAGIGAYAAKSAQGVIEGGYRLKLLKGFYSLWTSAIVAALIHASIFRTKRWFFVVHLILALLAAMIMGDRSQLFGVLIATIALLEVLRKQQAGGFRWVLWGAAAPIILLVINASVTFYRSQSSSSPTNADWAGAFGTARLLGNLFFSAESWAPFGGLVLMRIHDVPSLNGSTFWEIVLSFVPRFLMPSRLESGLSYTHYAYHTGLVEIRRGFGMHFVADAYLNGGVIAVVVVALLLGLFFGLVWRGILAKQVHVGTIIVYVTLAGFVPNLLRSGMGAVRYYAVEFLMIPMLFLCVIPFLLGRRSERIRNTGDTP